jgi:hypothetical protein
MIVFQLLRDIKEKFLVPKESILLVDSKNQLKRKTM